MDGPYSMYKVGDLEYKTFLNMFKKTWEGFVRGCMLRHYRLSTGF